MPPWRPHHRLLDQLQVELGKGTKYEDLRHRPRRGDYPIPTVGIEYISPMNEDAENNTIHGERYLWHCTYTENQLKTLNTSQGLSGETCSTQAFQRRHEDASAAITLAAHTWRHKSHAVHKLPDRTYANGLIRPKNGLNLKTSATRTTYLDKFLELQHATFGGIIV